MREVKVINFNEVIFNESINFRGTNFENHAYFYKSKFNKPIIFDEATFDKGANFMRVRFGDDAHFNKSRFNDEANFEHTYFNNSTFFIKTKFFDDATFNNAHFFGNATFDKAKFQEYTYFINAHFNQKLSLNYTGFNMLYLNWSSIRNNLVFNDTAYLSLVKALRNSGDLIGSNLCYYDYRTLAMMNSPFSYSSTWI